MNYKTGTTINCQTCGSAFYARRHQLLSGRKYCSRPCSDKAASIKQSGNPDVKARLGRARALRKIRGTWVVCAECGSKFFRYPCQFRRLRCSKACANAYVSKLYTGNPETLKRLAHAVKFKQSWSHQPEVTRAKLREIGLRIARRGAKSSFWKGGVATRENVLRHRSKYQQWREAVLNRDGYVCRSCGTQDNTLAHHIKPFKTFPALRYDVENGMALCTSCHTRHHSLERWIVRQNQNIESNRTYPL